MRADNSKRRPIEKEASNPRTGTSARPLIFIVEDTLTIASRQINKYALELSIYRLR
jgi:hypothetical protein